MMTENIGDNVKSAEAVPDEFTVKAAPGQRGLMITVIIVDILSVAFFYWLAFREDCLSALFNAHESMKWVAFAVVVLTALGSIFCAVKAGFCGSVEVKGDTLSVGGKSFKREEITGMERSGRKNMRCTIMAGKQKVCTVLEDWENFNLLQRWMKL